MEYLEYWSLREKPFAHDASSRFLCGSAQREVISGVGRLATSEYRSAVLASNPWCGATTLLRRIASTSGFGDRAVELLLTDGRQCSIRGVMLELAGALGFRTEAQPILAHIAAAIRATSGESVKVIWMVDHCSLPTARVAGRLARLGPMFAALLVGGNKTARRLAQCLSDLPSHRTPLQLELGPLSLPETGTYVRQSLEQTGGRSDMWSDSAIIRLYELSYGRLGRMSVAAESAMMMAAQHRMSTVSPAMVEAASERHSAAA
jgi:type II secretory pathway predicted ATPase ExeA